MRRLNSRTASLDFERESPNWYQLVLRRNDEALRLGADSFRAIAGKLLDFLAGRSQLPATDPGGNPKWKWILGLSEIHSSIYGTKLGDRYVFLVQNRNAKPVAEFSLDEAEAESWAQQIRHWLGVQPESPLTSLGS